MVGFIFAQHIVNQVGGKGDLLARLALAGMLAFDKPADHRYFAKGAFEQIARLHPVNKFIRQYVGRK